MMEAGKYNTFETLFRQHYSRLYFYALNLVNDSAAAEDVVEDVFSELWEECSRTVTSGQIPIPLLYARVRNRSIDYLRHAEVVRRYEENFDPHDLPYVENEEEEHDERIDQIKSAIEQLPAQTRRVFESCFLEGKYYKEAAEELDISVNTVKTLISRALTFIRGKVKRK